MVKLISMKEGANRLCISIHTLRAWTAMRKIPYVKVGRRVLLREEDIEQLVRSGLRAPEKDILTGREGN